MKPSLKSHFMKYPFLEAFPFSSVSDRNNLCGCEYLTGILCVCKQAVHLNAKLTQRDRRHRLPVSVLCLDCSSM